MSIRIQEIQAVIEGTRTARERVQQRSTDAIIHTLAQAARNWLEPGSVWRKRAIEQAPATTGFSSEMVNEAVDLTFGAITEGALRELLITRPTPAPSQEGNFGLGLPSRGGDRGGFIVHFLAGNVPAPGIARICSGLLLKSANLVKVSSRDPVFPALFAESLREVDAELADCVAVLDWRRDEVALTKAAMAEADAVIAYGDDDTIASLRELCRSDAQFYGYGHKLSFAVVAKEALTKDNLSQLAELAAFDTSVYDQQGCMSPHAFYIEEGGEISPREFASALAVAMAKYQERVPRGQLSVEEAAHIAKLRGLCEFWSAADGSVAVWSPGASNDWLVIFNNDPTFTPSCLNRVVFVKPVKQLVFIPQLVQRFASHLSTVGLAPLDKRAMGLSEMLFRVGVTRICAIGEMQRPLLSLSP